MATLSVEPNERVTFAVKHEDADLLVVRKPPGVVTQPGVGHEHDTLLNGLFARYGTQLQQLGAKRDFGLVHRLDRETSGLLLVALTADAYDGLREKFAAREISKYYWAVCHKAPREAQGVIKRPILEEERRKDRYTSEKKGVLSSGGKPAVTAYRVLDASPLGALIEARPVTGRLHQVRLHLDSIGAGILGDKLYGPTRTNSASHRLALHAHRIALVHPVTGEPLDVRTAFPKDLRRVLRALELKRPDLEEADEGGESPPA
jgi:23S rRNA pseudouridine1911/1915/1917 synthase